MSLAKNIRIAYGRNHISHIGIDKDAEMAGGEEVTIEEAVHLYYQRVYYFGLHLAGNPDDAKDLTQHAYEMLARNYHKISDHSKLKSWLHTTVYRKFIDTRRRTSRFPSVELEETHMEDTGSWESRGTDIDAQSALKAMHQLEDDLRAPLSLFYLESYSYKQIAETLGIPTGTVMSRLFRGKKLLYNILTEKAS